MSAYLIPVLLVLLVGFMFLSTRKQKRAVQQQQNMQKSLSYGDRVMTTSGLYASVVSTDEEKDTIDLELAPGYVTTWLRAAVREKVADTNVEELSDEGVEPVEDVADYEEIAEEPENAELTDESEQDEESETESDTAATPELEQSGKKSS